MKKKLAALAVMCVILMVLGGINTTLFYGTQYLTTKPGFGYTVSSGVTWWDCNWSYNKKITIDHTKVQSDQDYFPVLIYESSDADVAAHAQSDGDDIVFVDSSQTVQLHHEIEKYNSTTGELHAWVEIPHLLSTSDTIIYMYYGNPDCASQQNVEGTWNSNFAMVQHLKEDSGTHADSTSNGNDGTVTGGVTQGTTGRSVLDGSDAFNGTIEQYISFGNQTSVTPSSVTVEAWVKDPPKQNSPAVHILNKQQEQKTVLPNTMFSVERMITVDSPTDVVFVALCSPGVILKDMSVDGVSVFSGLYGAKKPTSSEEQRIENIRKKLPDEVLDFPVLAYSKPFHVENQTSVVMQFQSSGLNTVFSQGRISYLVLSQDNRYDVECTTHWYSGYNFIFSNSNEAYSRAADSLLKNEKSTLVSTTSFIHTNPCFFNFLNLPCFNSFHMVISSLSGSCFAPVIISSINASSLLRFASNVINSSIRFSKAVFSRSSIFGILISRLPISITNVSMDCHDLNGFAQDVHKTTVMKNSSPTKQSMLRYTQKEYAESPVQSTPLENKKDSGGSVCWLNPLSVFSSLFALVGKRIANVYKFCADGEYLLVSPKHNVYSFFINSSTNSCVFNTTTADCFFNCFSSDQRMHEYFRDTAKYGASLGCLGNRDSAFGIKGLYSSFGTNVIRFSAMDSNRENSSFDRCVFFNISDLCFENSSRIFSGATKFIFSEKNSISDFQLPLINNEKSSFASTTANIYLAPFFANASVTFAPSLSASFSVNSLCDLNFLRNSRSAIFCLNASRATADQFISENDSILCLSSCGTDNVSVVIPSTSMYDYIYYVYYVQTYKSFGLAPVTEAYQRQGNENLNFMDEKGSPVQIESIKKESYQGPIYDVDVPNDIVLVRRGNGSAFWCRNSDSPIDHATQQPMLRYTQKEYAGSPVQSTPLENKKDGGGSVCWLNPISVFSSLFTLVGKRIAKVYKFCTDGGEHLLVSPKHKIYATNNGYTNVDSAGGTSGDFSQKLCWYINLSSSLVHLPVVCDQSGAGQLSAGNENSVKTAASCSCTYPYRLVQKEDVVDNVSMVSDVVRCLDPSLILSSEPCCYRGNFNETYRGNVHYGFSVFDLLDNISRFQMQTKLFAIERILLFSPWRNDSLYQNCGIQGDSAHDEYFPSRILRISSVESSSEIRSLAMSLFNSDNDRDFFCLENFNSSISACNSRSTSSNLFRITAPSIGITDDNETEAIYKHFPRYTQKDYAGSPVQSIPLENKKDSGGSVCWLNPEGDIYQGCDLRYLANFVVSNTSIIVCLLKNASCDQIGQRSFNASANKSISSRNSSTSFLGETLFNTDNACFNSSLYWCSGMNSTCSFNRKSSASNILLFIFDFRMISPEYFCNSLSENSGDINSKAGVKRSSLVNDSFLKKENSTLVSTTSFTYTSPFFCSSLNLPFRAFLDHSRTSLSETSLSFNSSLIFSNCVCFLILFKNMFRATSDQFTQENCCMSCFDFSSIVSVILTIYNPPSTSSNRLSFLILSLMPLRSISDQLSSGYLFNWSLSSLGIDNVTLAIRSPQCVYKHKDVEIYKLSDGKETATMSSSLTHQPMLRYTQKEYTGSPVQSIPLENKKDSGSSVDWWNPYSIFSHLLDVLFGKSDSSKVSLSHENATMSFGGKETTVFSSELSQNDIQKNNQSIQTTNDIKSIVASFRFWHLEYRESGVWVDTGESLDVTIKDVTQDTIKESLDFVASRSGTYRAVLEINKPVDFITVQKPLHRVSLDFNDSSLVFDYSDLAQDPALLLHHEINKENHFCFYVEKTAVETNEHVVFDPEYTVKSSASATGLSNNCQRKLVRTSDGILHCVYYRTYNGKSNIMYANSTDNGQTWTETILTSDSTYAYTYPAIAVDTNNVLHVVFEGQIPSPAAVEEIRYMNCTNGVWSAIQNITTYEVWHRIRPVIAVNASNALCVAWYYTAGAYDYLQCSFFNSSSWSSPQTITAVAEYDEYPSIASSSDGRFHLAWMDLGYSVICYANYSNGQWSSIQSLTDGLIDGVSIYDENPCIAVDKNDGIHISCDSYDDNSYMYIRYLNSSNGGTTWTITNFTVNEAGVNNYYSSLAFDEQGNRYIFWEGIATVTYYQIRYLIYTASTQTWSSPQNLTSNSATHHRPNLICSANPIVNHTRPSYPRTGYALIYMNGTTIQFYSSSDLSWEYAPTITSPYPSNESTSIPPIPTLNITVSDQNGDPMTITWRSNSSGSWVQFGQNTSVANGTYYQTNSNLSFCDQTYYWNVTVTDGNTTNTSDMFHFTTKVIPIVTVDTSDSDVSLYYPCQRKIIRSPNGTLYVVYTKSVSSTSQIFLGQSTDNGTTWTTSQFTMQYAQVYPSIASDNLGNLHIVWSGYNTAYHTSSRYQIRYMKYTASTGTWSDPVNITAEALYHSYPSIAVDSNNNIYVVWHGSITSGGVNNVRYCRYDGSSWSAPGNISTDSTYGQSLPSIAVDSSNNVHVVWLGAIDATTITEIRYSEYTGGGWTAPTNLTNSDRVNGCTQENPCITTNGANVYVVWDGIPSSESDLNIRFMEYTGSSWTAPINITNHPDGGQYSPSVAVSQDQVIHVAWEGDDSGDAEVKYSNYTTSWLAPINLTKTNGWIPNFIDANYPVVNNAKTGKPKTGFGMIYIDGNGGYPYPYRVMYAHSADLTFNDAPTISAPHPENASTGVTPFSSVNITINDLNGDPMNITWMSNSSGSWQQFGSISSSATNQFGYDTAGSSWIDLNQTIRGSRFTCPANGIVDTIYAYLNYGAEMGKPLTIKGAIYRASDNTLVAATQEISVGWQLLEPTWQDFTFSSPPAVTAGTNYYLCVWANTSASSGNFADLCYNTLSGSSRGAYQSQTYGSFPNTWSPTTDDKVYSLYCTYTTSSLSNGTYSMDNMNFSSTSTTYYWRVNVTDGYSTNTSPVYHFTTAASPTLPTVTTNTSTGVLNVNATLNGYLGSDGSATTTCGLWYDTTSGGTSHNQSVGTVSNATTFSYNASSLTPGQLYYFKAWANNSAGFNGTSNEMTFLTKPNASTSFTATAYNETRIDLSWTNGTGLNKTYIEYSTTSSSWPLGSGLFVYNDSVPLCSHTGLSENVTYYYEAWSYTTWAGLIQWSDANASTNKNTSSIKPAIQFIDPTPANDTHRNQTWINVSLSTSDASQHYAFTDFNRSCKLWMRMDDVNGTGDPQDISGYGNNGIKQGNAAQTSSGYFGKGFSFDGDKDYINLTSSTGVNLVNEITISAWIKTNDPTKRQVIVTKTAPADNTWLLEINPYDCGGDGILTFYYYHDDDITGYFCGNTMLMDNTWYHVVVTVNSTFMYLYINGTVDSTLDIVDYFGEPWPGFRTNSQPILIGDWGDLDRSFDGTIDDVLIFNRSLSAGEIQSLYNASTYQYNHNFTSLPDGAHNFTGYAVDRAGNKNQTETRNVTVDTVLPSVQFVTPPTPANNTAQSNTYINVSLSSSDTNQHYSFLDFNRSLVGWWRMDDVDSSGNPQDISGYGNHGTKQGNAAQTNSGYYGKGFSFDGNGDYISVPDLQLEDQFTASMWFKRAGPSGGSADSTYHSLFSGLQPNVSGGDGYLVVSSDGSAVEFSARSGAAFQSAGDNPSILGDNNWHMITGVRNATAIILYIDGVLKNASAVSPTTNVGGTMRIGCWVSISNYYNTNGSIDEILVFNRSLSTAEIQSLYNASTYQYNHNFTGLTNATYNFTGYAVDRAGNKNQTETRYVTIESATPVVTTNASTGVQNVNATLWGYLSSDGNVAATCGFYYDTVSGGTSHNQSVGTVASGSTFSYNASGLTPGQLYYFKTWASNSVGFNGTANELTFLTKPNATIGFTATAYNTTQINLTWTTTGSGANYTYIEYGWSSEFLTEWNFEDGYPIYNGTDASFSHTNLRANTTYYYKAWSYTEWDGLNQWSDTGSTTYNTTFKLDLLNCSTDQGVYNNGNTVTYTAWVNATIGDTVVLLIANSISNLTNATYTNRTSCIANSSNVTITSQPQQITATMAAGSSLTWYAKAYDNRGDWSYTQENTTAWNKTFNGNSSTGADDARAIAVDSNGNVYVVGSGLNLVSGSSGYDWWIKKFSSAGVEDTVNWNKSFNGNSSTGADYAYSVAIDSNGNVYVAGIGVNLISGSSGNDWWIKKFSSAGVEDTANWNKSFNGGSSTGSDAIRSIVVDSSGNVYAVGSGVNLVSGSSSYDWWIKKFSSAGVEDTVNWNKSFNGGSSTGADYAYSVALDSSGNNVYVAGYAINVASGSSGTDWWIKKFSSAGVEDTVNWNKSANDPSDSTDNAYALTVDSNGNVYVVGRGNGLVDPDTGSSYDWWIKKYSSNGVEDTTNWNKQYDDGSYGTEVAYSVAVDFNGNVYVVGYAEYLFGDIYLWGSSYDWWIKKFSADGTEDKTNWNKSYYTSGNDIAYTVAVDSNKSIYVGGYGTNLISGSSNRDWWIKKYDYIYGNFTVNAVVLPTVTTNASTGVKNVNATLNGYLSSDGTATTTCGFYYDTTLGGTTHNQSIGTVSQGSTFSYNASLLAGQLYYFKAWASNSGGFNGTSNELVFLTKPNATTNFTARSNSSTMIYLSWTNGTGANKTYIERNTTSSWAFGSGTYVYNNTGTNYENTSLSANTTYYYQAWSYTTWAGLIQWSDANASASNTTNALPEITNPGPSNGSTGVSVLPWVNITVNDYNGDTMTITWYSNSSGSWVAFGQNSSCVNGTYRMTNSNFSNYSVTYYWNVSVTDNKDTNISGIYWFTTTLISTSVNAISPYQQSTNPLALTATGDTSLSNVTLCYRYSTDNSSWTGMSSNWWNTGWSYRKLITIDHTKVAETLTNFPILYAETSDSNLSAYAQSSGNDICFILYSDNTTKLNHEIENYTSATGKLISWINVTSLSSTADTLIWMYYGNSTCSSQQNIPGTWDDGYVGVYHFGEGSGSAVKDSNYVTNGTLYQTDHWNTSGILGNSYSFDGADDGVNLGYLNLTKVTMEVWFNVPSWHNYQTPIAKDNTGTYGPRYIIEYNSKGRLRTKVSTASGTYQLYCGDTHYFVNNTIYYAVSTYDGETMHFYSNGTMDQASPGGENQSEAATGDILTSLSTAKIGMETFEASKNFWGTEDEVRLSNIARSAGWIATTYNTINSPSTFSTTGNQEQYTGGWRNWSNADNPDAASPWSWNFDFPNSTGYYEFYSIGKKSGSTDESAPGSADAICHYTASTPPTITTNASTGIQNINATLNGYLSSDGGGTTTCGFYYDTTSGGTSHNQSVGTVTSGSTFSYNASSLTPGQLYYFKAWGSNSGGFNGTSNEQTFLTKPNAPTGFTATAYNETRIDLNWTTAGTGANKTYIEYNTTSSSWAMGQGTFLNNSTGTTYSHTGLTENQTIYYQAWSYTTWAGLTQWSDANASTNKNTSSNKPTIQFIDPTPANDTHRNSTWVYVNVSTSDASTTSSFLNWDNSLLGYWSMQWHNATGVYDNSTYNNFATFKGGLQTGDATSGKFGNAFDFDGSSDYLEVADVNSIDFDASENYTWTMWIYPAGMVGFHGIMGKCSGTGDGVGYSIMCDIDGGGICFSNNKDDEGIWGNNGIASNTWYFVAITYANGLAKIYIDGALDASSNSLTFTDDTTNPVFIGRGYDTAMWGIDYFPGIIDEPQIWNRVLTWEEINASYNSSANQLYHNFTGLSDGKYPYYAHAIDTAGNENTTEIRNVTIDTVTPTIQFVSPTPDNDTYRNSTWVNVSLSSSDTNQHYSFLDFNKSNVLWMRMDTTTSESGVISDDTEDSAGGNPDQFENLANAYDENWDTYADAMDYNSIIYINYTVPSGVTGATDEYKVDVSDDYGIEVWCKNQNTGSYDFLEEFFTAGYHNVSIPSDCIGNAGSTVSMIFILKGEPGYGYPYFYEDKMKWSVTNITVVDESSYSNNGLRQGDAEQTDNGYFGKGFSFDGDGDYISVGDIFDATQDFSISVWIKPLVNGEYQAIAIQAPSTNGGNPWAGLYLMGTDQVAFGTGDSYVLSDMTLSTGIYYHIVGVTHGDTGYIYINGTEQKSGECLIESEDGNLNIGRKGDKDMNYFNGIIDEAFIFNRALNSSEIQSLYNASATQYQHNFTGLSDGTHNLTGYAVDRAGNKNQTETRNVTVDTIAPAIQFVDPTPANGSTHGRDYINVSISSSDANQHYVFTSFNDDLRFWMRMDDVDGSGNPQDISGYENHGTKEGDAVQTDNGYYGKAFTYDGDGDAINLTSAPENRVTVSAWFKTTENGTIYGEGQTTGEYYLKIYTSGSNISASRHFGSGEWQNLTASVNANNNQWHHVVFTANTTDYLLFFDGSIVASTTLQWFVGEPIGLDAAIGNVNQNGVNSYFTGSIDDVIIFSRSLDSTEIGALYNASVTQYQHNFTGLPDGNYTFTGYANDRAGNKNQTETRWQDISRVPIVVTNTTTGIGATNATLNGYLNYSGGESCSVKFEYWRMQPHIFYTSSSDGGISKNSATYAGARTSATGTVTASSTTFEIGQSYSSLTAYTIRRGFVFFDSSSIPAAATINDATIALYGSSDQSTSADFDITVQNGQSTYPHDPLETGDYDMNHYTGDGGSINTAGFTTSGYNTITLNADALLYWITMGGTTKLCLRSSRDINGNSPGSGMQNKNEYVAVYANEQGTGYQPKLTVNYSLFTDTQTKSEGDEFSQDVTELDSGMLYQYRAYAENSHGNDYGDIFTFLTKPQPPSTFTASAYDNSRINLSWTPGSGANTTYIERNTTASWPWGQGRFIYNGTETSCQDSDGLTPGVQYYYRAWSFTTWTYDSTTLNQWSETNTSATTNASAYNKEILNMSWATYSLDINATGNVLCGYVSNTMIQTSIDTDWHYVVLTYDGSVGTMSLYKDGELASTASAGSISYPTQIPNLIAGKSLSGNLDELRISSTARTGSWINTAYQNTYDPESFATFGSETGILSAWMYRKKITINHNLVNGTLTNFPVLIYNASDTDLKNNAQPTGNDIIFMNTSVDWTTGTWRDKLDHEIEKYDSSTGELVAWVRIPTLSSTTDTEIYMYYNNSLCTTNRENPSGVWDSNYVMVQHLNNPTGSPILDSTSNNNDGTKQGDAALSSSGKIDGAYSLDGTGDYINISSSASIDFSQGTNYTYFFWTKPSQITTGTLLSHGLCDSSGVSISIYEGNIVIKEGYIPGEITMNAHVSSGVWSNVAVVLEINTPPHFYTVRCYINGTLVDSNTLDIYSSSEQSAIGAWYDAGGGGFTDFFNGTIDEVRLSNMVRNSSWINTSYNTMNDTRNFTSFSAQEIKNVAPEFSGPNPSDGAAEQNLYPALSVNIQDANADSLDITWMSNSSGTWQQFGSVRSSATNQFGYASVGSDSVPCVGVMRGNNFTCPANGTAANIYAYTSCSVVDPDRAGLKCALYYASTNTLLANTQEIVKESSSTGWDSFTFGSPPMLTAGTAYYIVLWAAGNIDTAWVTIASDTMAGCSRGAYQEIEYGEFPNPWSPTTEDNIYSLYCTYTTSSVSNGTYSMDNLNFSSPGTKYYWSVNATDGSLWENTTYSLTTEGIGFGSATVYESATTNYNFVTRLDSTHVVAVYTDGGNSNKGTAVVGTISENSISFGTPIVFNNAATSPESVTALDSTHVVIAYRNSDSPYYGLAIVGTVTGNSISFGDAVVFHGDSLLNLGVSVAALDSTHIVIASINVTGYGLAIVGTVSGNSISFGSETMFARISCLSVTMLDSTHVVIAYNNITSPQHGAVIVGTVSGNSISFGSEAAFNSVATSYISVAALDTSHVVIAYRNDTSPNNGTSVVGTVSGSSISYGALHTFNAASTQFVSVTALDSTHVAVAYCDNGNSQYGTARVGTVSGSSISYGIASVFEASIYTYYISDAALDSSHVVVAYKDYGNSDYGTAVVGTYTQ